MDVTMPQLGETVTEGTITKWFKQVGEKVRSRRAAVRGVDRQGRLRGAGAVEPACVSEIVVPEGDTVPVGARLAVIGDGAGAAAPRRGGRRRGGAARPHRPAPATGAARRRRLHRPAPPPAAARAARSAAPAAGTASAGTRAVERRRHGDLTARAPLIAEDGTRPEPDPRHRRRRPHHPQRRAASGARVAMPVHRRPRAPGAPAAPAPAAAARAAAVARGRRRRDRAVRQHPAPHGRAHGAVEGHERARVHVGARSTSSASSGCGARIRRRGRPKRASRSPTCRSSCGRSPTSSTTTRTSTRASTANAGRAPRRESRHRGRPRLQGLDRAGRSATPTASACG